MLFLFMKTIFGFIVSQWIIKREIDSQFDDKYESDVGLKSIPRPNWIQSNVVFR